jgi:NitT/TauT family transport system permease protein
MNLKNHDSTWRWAMWILFFIVFISAWELFGRIFEGLLIAPFSKTFDTFIELLGSRKLYQAFWVSNQALVLGFTAAVLFAIPVGLLLGRNRKLERVFDVYLNILIVSPIAALIPLIIILFGFGLFSRVFVVFLFTFPIIAINSRAGLKNLDKSLVEMSISLGASENQLWRKILIPGASPAIFTGIRLGIGRAFTGMIVVELILIAVGLGGMILEANSLFAPEITYSIAIILILEVLFVTNVFRYFEKRILSWKTG